MCKKYNYPYSLPYKTRPFPLFKKKKKKKCTPRVKPGSTRSILQQNRNTTLNIKRWAAQSHAKATDTLKLTAGHFTALQREVIQLHPPEHRHKLPQTEKLASH